MTFFIDANIAIYTRLPTEYREPCLDVFAAVAAGEADGTTSTAVMEEVWHLELSGHAGQLAGLTADTHQICRPVLPVTDEIFARALSLPGTRIGANDRVHVATCLLNGIDTILSADKAFDAAKQLRRVDPLDRRALAELLSIS